MAADAIREALRCFGGNMTNGAMICPRILFNSHLDNHFGLFTVDRDRRVVYKFVSLDDIEESERAVSVKGDDSFAQDVRSAVKQVRSGTTHAILFTAIVDVHTSKGRTNDSYTMLCLFPRECDSASQISQPLARDQACPF